MNEWRKIESRQETNVMRHSISLPFHSVKYHINKQKKEIDALKTLMLPDSVVWLCLLEMNPLGNFQNCSASWHCAVIPQDRLAANVHVNTNLDYVLLFYRCQR